ncbi:type III secretion system IpaD/SipD/SspD family effector [Oxalobacteraceae bacterium GrIS 2.11]
MDTVKGNNQTASAKSTNQSASEVKTTTSTWKWSLLNSLPGHVKSMQDNYISPYTAAVQLYTKFMADIADLMTIVSGSSHANSDSNYINFGTESTVLKIDAISKKYDMLKNPLYSSKAVGEAGKAEANRWAEEFGLDPAKCVQEIKGDGGESSYVVIVDLSPLATMQLSLKNGKLSIQEYQQMMAALDGQKQILQSTVQVLTEKYGRANANLDSMFRLISGIIADLQQQISRMMQNAA